MKITRIKTNNFRSLANFEIGFDENSNINIIYGINGSGKSTFVSIFELLSFIINRNHKAIMREIHESLFSDDDEITSEDAYNLRRNNKLFSNKKNIYDDNITIKSENEEIQIEIDFIHNNKNYNYAIEITRDNTIKNESYSEEGKLLFSIERDNTNEAYITLEKNNFKLSEVLEIPISLKDAPYLRIIKDTSFLSLVSFVETDFLEKDLLDKMQLFKELIQINNYIRFFSFRERANISLLNERMIRTEINILIEEKEEEIFTNSSFLKFKENTENLVSTLREIDETIIGHTNSIKLMTERIKQNEEIKFAKIELALKRMIKGKVREIPFHLESTGTKKYIEIYRVIEQIKNDNNRSIIVIDEFGKSFNETLIINIFNYLEKIARKHNKQLFFTTHNTILLNKKFNTNYNESSLLWNKEKFIIYRDKAGNNKAINLKGIDKKENNQIKYILGDYKGNILRDLFDD